MAKHNLDPPRDDICQHPLLPFIPRVFRYLQDLRPWKFQNNTGSVATRPIRMCHFTVYPTSAVPFRPGLMIRYDPKFVGMHLICSFRIHTMHLPHNPNPTHCVAYTRQSQFLRINSTSCYFAYNLFALS